MSYLFLFRNWYKLWLSISKRESNVIRKAKTSDNRQSYVTLFGEYGIRYYQEITKDRIIEAIN